MPYPKPHPAPPHCRVHALARNNSLSPQKTWCLSCKRGATRLDSADPETEGRGLGTTIVRMTQSLRTGYHKHGLEPTRFKMAEGSTSSGL